MLGQQSLQEKLERIQARFGHSGDLIIKRFTLSGQNQTPLALIYLETMTSVEQVDQMLESMMSLFQMTEQKGFSEAPLVYLKQHLLPQSEAGEITEWTKLEEGILQGRSIFLSENDEHALAAMQARNRAERSVEEPSTQTVVRGPRDGFTETLNTNIGLVRKRIKDPNLWVELRKIGDVTQTEVALMYLHGTVSEEILTNLRERLDKIETESVLESGYIEEWITEKEKSPFPTVFNTERPDVTASGILEGRVAILIDGTPFILMVPALFVQFFQAAEDYYHPALFSSLRTLRFIASFGALLLPAIYIAVTTYHQEIIPTSLLISIMAQREGVPFPTFIEAMIMEITFEVLREAGIRMPKMIGQAISIVGALVLGEAAVQAGLISAAMVIVVAFTAITNLMIPSISMGNSIRILRFLFMFMAAIFGLYGLFIGVCMLHIHLCHLKSFGVPYMYPIAPYSAQGIRDTFFRVHRKGKNKPEDLFKHIELEEE